MAWLETPETQCVENNVGMDFHYDIFQNNTLIYSLQSLIGLSCCDYSFNLTSRRQSCDIAGGSCYRDRHLAIPEQQPI